MEGGVLVFGLPISDTLAIAALIVVLAAEFLGPKSDSLLESVLLIGSTLLTVLKVGGPF